MNASDSTTAADDTQANEAAEEAVKLNLEIEVTSPSACQRHIKVSVPREDIDRYYDKEFSEMMEKAVVPGFRPGRAPRKLVENQFRKDVGERIKGSLLMDSMAQVSEDEDFSAISEPDFDYEAIELPEEGPLTYEFDLEVRPDFAMPKWKGLKLETPHKEFDDKDIDKHLSKLLERHAELEPYDGSPEAGDLVTVNLKFLHDGKEIAKTEDVDLDLRSTLSFQDANLEGFDKLLKSAKPGSKVTGKAKVSADSANEEIQGKEVDVEVELKEVSRYKLPELNDEFLKTIGNFDNEGDLRDAVKGEMERQLRYKQNQGIRKQITDLLTEAATWELPPQLLKRQAQREYQRAIMELRYAGFDDQKILEYANALQQNSQQSVATALKEHFILERIAEDEELDATPSDYDSEISIMAMQSGESPRSVRARIEKQGLMDALRNQIVERKAIELIKEQASFEKVPYKQEESQVSPIDFAIGGSQKNEIPEAHHADGPQELSQPVDRT